MKQRKSLKWLWIAALLGCAGATGPKGDTGEAGPAGQNGLVSVGAEPAGANCSGGGAVIKSGLDSNGNGTLDASEVTNTSYACTGSPDTAAQLLAKIVTVDGAGSGLDADLLQGESLDTVAPPGTVVAFAGPSTRIPNGWLLCDGRTFPRVGTYGKLFAAIGVFHGIGDGTTTFAIPDYRGRFLRGVAYTSSLDPDKNARTVIGAGSGVVSDEVGSVQGYATHQANNAFGTDVQGAHTHNSGNFNRLLQVSGGTNTTTTGTDVSATEPDIINSAAMVSAGAHSHNITGGDAETRPVNSYVNYIIKF